MRPPGDIRHALLKAAQEFKAQGIQPTMRDMAVRAQVGIKEATTTVKNMSRAKQLVPCSTRRVDYCNKPVAVYDLPDPSEQPCFVDLAQVMGCWAN